MNGTDPSSSRIGRKNGRNRINKLLNIMIAVVAILIVITATVLFSGNNGDGKTDKQNASSGSVNSNQNDENSANESGSELDSASEEESTDNTEITDVEENTNSEEPSNDSTTDESGNVTTVPSDDDYVSETIINSAWKPIGTKQVGEHVSIYERESVDWKEKVEALAYATGLQQDSLIVWKIKNGGSPQKSVGIVSSNDRSEKYRVNLEWVDNEGWKPVQMDILTTLDFEY